MTTESMTMKTQENSAEVGIDVQRLVRDALRYRAIKKKIDYSEGDDGMTWAKVKAASVAAPTEERATEARCAEATGSAKHETLTTKAQYPTIPCVHTQACRAKGIRSGKEGVSGCASGV